MLGCILEVPPVRSGRASVQCLLSALWAVRRLKMQTQPRVPRSSASLVASPAAMRTAARGLAAGRIGTLCAPRDAHVRARLRSYGAGHTRHGRADRRPAQPLTEQHIAGVVRFATITTPVGRWGSHLSHHAPAGPRAGTGARECSSAARARERRCRTRRTCPCGGGGLVRLRRPAAWPQAGAGGRARAATLLVHGAHSRTGLAGDQTSCFYAHTAGRSQLGVFPAPALGLHGDGAAASIDVDTRASLGTAAASIVLPSRAPRGHVCSGCRLLRATKAPRQLFLSSDAWQHCRTAEHCVGT